MDKITFWKNFELGIELNVSGRFIYNGLQTFHEMKHFAHEEEIFEFLYHISVGIERLLKIAIILIEHDQAVDQNNTVDQNNFEKSLMTHNHERLIQRVRKKYKLSFSKHHNEFLSLLGKFYKTSRYGRYSPDVMERDDWRKSEIIDFLNNNLSISIDTKTMFEITPNNKEIKKFIGETVGKISRELYKVIIKESHRLNIYTWEIRSASKASKIFLSNEYDFEKEDILRRELLLYFINSSNKGGLLQFMESLEPLDFDPASESDYIGCFDSNVKAIGFTGELEGLYEEGIDDQKKRKEYLELIGNPNVCFDSDEDDEEQD